MKRRADSALLSAAQTWVRTDPTSDLDAALWASVGAFVGLDSKTINVSCQSSLTDTDLVLLLKLAGRKLTSLNTNLCCRLTERTVAAVACFCPDVKSLVFDAYACHNASALTEELARLEHLEELRVLRFRDQIEADHIRALTAGCRSLRALDLPDNCTVPGDAVLAEFSRPNAPPLRRIAVLNSPSFKAWNALPTFAALQHIDLFYGIDFRASTIVLQDICAELRLLMDRAPNMSFVRIQNGQISDASVVRRLGERASLGFKVWPNLRKLEFNKVAFATAQYIATREFMCYLKVVRADATITGVMASADDWFSY